MDKEKLLEYIKSDNFDEAKKVAFNLIQTDDADSVQWVLDEAKEYKNTVTYKIVEKMLKYI